MSEVLAAINGDATNKNLLSMQQLDATDIADYIDVATVIEKSKWYHNPVLPGAVLKAVMKQPSTRTGGSCTTAMQKLGGSADLISGMEASSEAKGETPADSWVAFATQSDILGIRSKDEGELLLAAESIAYARHNGKLSRPVPVINLGNGTDEHPTQALGDLYTIQKYFGQLSDLKLTVVGDHERYRAHHSLLIGAAAVGMNVVAVQVDEAPVPDYIKHLLDGRLQTTEHLDDAMKETDVLYIGRCPDEYAGEDTHEINRMTKLEAAYSRWIVDYARLQQMPQKSIVMHPRPRKPELDPSCDPDPRMHDIQQMENMIPMRMAIFARHLGAEI